MRKLVSIVTVLLAPLGLVAQDAGATSVATDPMIPFYLAVALLFIVALLVIVVAVYMLQVLQILTNEEARKQAAAKGIPYVPEPSWWAKFTTRPCWQTARKYTLKTARPVTWPMAVATSGPT